MSHSNRKMTEHLTLTALFCALAYLCVLLPAPKVQFLSFDIKDAVIAMGSLFLGPTTAVSLSVAVPILESITVGTTGPWGLLMDVLSTMSFSVTASLLYTFRKTLKGALVALASAVLCQIAVMMGANVLITPLYTGAPRAAVIAMLLPLLLPFNAVKSVCNAALVMLLYKPFTEVLRRAGGLRGTAASARPREREERYRLRGKSLLVFLLSLLLVVLAALVLFLVLGARFGGESV